MKHYKYRNTGLLFELLTRQITVDAMNGVDNSKAMAILQKNFSKSSELYKENQLQSVLMTTKMKQKERATHLIETTIKSRKSIVKESKLNREKYDLIKQIKESFDLNDFFKSRINNYKLIAASYNVLTENHSDPVKFSKSHFTVMENICNDSVQKNSKLYESLKKENSDLRALSYKFMVEKFNKKYVSLSKEQKECLREYINNLSNTNGLSEFVESKFKHVVYELKQVFPKIDDKIVRIKIKECVSLISSAKNNSKAHPNNILKLMRFYQLLEDVKRAVKSA